MKAKKNTQRNYTIGIPTQYRDNQNLYTTSTTANQNSSLLTEIGNVAGGIISGVNNAVNTGLDIIFGRSAAANDNATLLEQERLNNSGNTTTTLLICAALVVVVYFYFKK